MHPILARPGRLLPYLAACAPLAAIVTALLARPGGLFLGEAIALAVPLTVGYAFMGLSPWYLCRQFPLKRARILPIVLAHALAGAVIASLWVGLAALLAAGYGLVPAFQGLPGRFAAPGDRAPRGGIPPLSALRRAQLRAARPPGGAAKPSAGRPSSRSWRARPSSRPCARRSGRTSSSTV